MKKDKNFKEEPNKENEIIIEKVEKNQISVSDIPKETPKELQDDIKPKKYLYVGDKLVIGLFMLEHNTIYTIENKQYEILISQVPKLKDVLLEINHVNSDKVFRDLENRKHFFKKISMEIKNEINKVGE